MAALGQGVDALSIAAPVLKSGPSAYETVTARMGIEGDNAKLAAAKEVEKDKAKAERGKAFEIDLGTVELPDTIAWNKKMAQEQDLYAAELQAFEEGKGDDPDDPRSKAGQARMARLQGYKQYVSNSKQKMAYGNTLLGLVRSKPHAYQAGAEEATLAWMSDPTVNETGEIIDPLEQYYNLDADLKATLGDLAASGGGTAGRDANGDVITTETEYVLPADVLGGVQMVLQNPAAGKEALRRFAELQGRDPVAAENVLKVAEKNKIPAEAAMIWNEAAKVYGYSKYKKTLAQQSDGSARRADEEEVASEFVKAVENVTNGTHQGFSNLYEAFPGIPKEKVGSFVRNNPVITSLFDYDAATGEHSLKPGYEIVKDFNRLTVDVKPEAGVGNYKTPELPIKVQGAIRAANGNVTILTATDDDFKAGKVKASPPIPKEDIFQKVVYPSLWNGGDYNPVSAAGMQRAMEKMGYDVKTETMNQWNKKFVYKDPDAKTPTTAPQKPATTFIP